VRPFAAVASNNAKQFLGTDIRALKDATGGVYGLELYERDIVRGNSGTVTSRRPRVFGAEAGHRTAWAGAIQECR
jgi:hypothetical protein